MEKTNGTWSHKDGVLKCGSEVVVNYIKDIRTGWQLMQRLELFDWVCKTLNKQELLDERLEKQLKDLKPIVNETHEKKPLVGYDKLIWPYTVDAVVWATEFCNRNTAADEFILLLKHKKNDKQGIDNNPDGSKPALLYLEKVTMDGKEKFKLVGCENILRKDQLPNEYTDSAPNFYLSTSLHHIIMNFKSTVEGKNHSIAFNIGDAIDPEYIKDFKACGERLASINRRLKEARTARFTVKI